MPLYEYQCDACGKRFEVIQKFTDPAPDACRKCGNGPVHRLHSSPAIQFKGSGWYVTDYAQKSSTDSGKSADKSAGSVESGSAATTTTSEGSKTESSPKSDAAPQTSSPSAPAKE